MITPQVKGTKVVFGPCRLSYTHVFDKYAPDDDPTSGKYMTNILIPKKEEETVEAIKKAIEVAKKAATISKWGGKEPKKLNMPLHDGSVDKEDDEIYANCYYLNAKSATRPGICDEHKIPITDEDEIYSGVWAYISVTFFGYNINGNHGVACGLNNIMKFKDDEQLGGRASAKSDFSNIDSEGDNL